MGWSLTRNLPTAATLKPSSPKEETNSFQFKLPRRKVKNQLKLFVNSKAMKWFKLPKLSEATWSARKFSRNKPKNRGSESTRRTFFARRSQRYELKKKENIFLFNLMNVENK